MNMLNVLMTFCSQYDLFFLQYVKKWQISAMNSMIASITLHNLPQYQNHYCTYQYSKLMDSVLQTIILQKKHGHKSLCGTIESQTRR